MSEPSMRTPVDGSKPCGLPGSPPPSSSMKGPPLDKIVFTGLDEPTPGRGSLPTNMPLPLTTTLENTGGKSRSGGGNMATLLRAIVAFARVWLSKMRIT